MLEVKILQKMIDLFPVSDSTIAKKVLERSGVRFIFTGGKSGVYKGGMLKLDESQGLVDFNVAAVRGLLVPDVGGFDDSGGLEVDQSSVVQDLQNRLAEYDLEVGSLRGQVEQLQRDLATAQDGEAEAKAALSELLDKMENAADEADNVLGE